MIANMRRTRIVRHMHGRGGLVQEDLVRVTPNYFYRGDWIHRKPAEGSVPGSTLYTGAENDRRFTGDDDSAPANTLSNGDVYTGPLA